MWSHDRLRAESPCPSGICLLAARSVHVILPGIPASRNTAIRHGYQARLSAPVINL